MIKTQLAAVSVISKVMAGASLTAVLQDLWRTDVQLSQQQRGAIQDISYGVLRFYGQLDAILGGLLRKALDQRCVHYLLLVGLYQLQYSRARPHTVVDQAVSASRSLTKGHGIQGLINAVLRNFIRQREHCLEQAAEHETGRYSYPSWWIDRVRLQYPHHYQSILESGNKRPPMTLRINQRKISVEDYDQLLAENGLQAERLWNGALRLIQPVSVDDLPGFHAGLVTVQDAGAQLAAPFLDVRNGMRVLDACAAPGGKSTHLLELADVSLTSLDSDPIRLAQIAQNLQRLNMDVERLVCADASQPEQWWDGQSYDRILADVPCSASGVVCRHPDIKWLRRDTDLVKFATHQQAILNALWKILNKNGKLLYVTCSIFAEENTVQIERFLENHSDAYPLSLSEAALIDGQLLPTNHHDGFFYTLLQKK
ncbi:16S rRNA (cytosine(967)-C(5))-methyltransferase RsmB [Nitrosomonas sp. JL21]|uniref:16S rRNA (cytosine(967)-C(5))-methyltransferase RsmB n=1 Tax=Nitrosomonas sp. JL21 TaxID=153949 RepID=UPI00136F979A|nr:16S rRNA (cytosine(967)-C(5))-methyltransferase RsmB [Nitrosomonas sp. JL21]MBL8498567.1 16S rRNA (cytosine(967)-C(5))-methyltransferase RsmB [Nitrosomonas sp.]MCC7091231.1 16S rRNA (cytosine(967)-C(5))-methyltransferase RsmB [Nitrosomonas sp.]MXS78999.1 16S rRNA (cytosine(967)-C(5))-methyltransferase RsmB [Nitrosomonas sp. JL21]